MTVILGGGRGTRLFPLTKARAKPAVPLGGKYRLIDIPVSNAINSGFPHIYVLTQFNSASLNQHITRTYQFDQFHDGFVRVLAPEQTDDQGSDWYQGTADAVRKQLRHFVRPDVEHVVILSGDHLYRMDYRELVARHEQAGADVTMACLPVDESDASRFGLLSPDDDGLVTQFVEKPKTADALAPVRVPDALRHKWGLAQGKVLASMGVYVFRKEALVEALRDPDRTDFGNHILPGMIDTHRVAAHLFDDYWADIGTIAAFYEANLSLTAIDPPFRFWDSDAPIYTRARILPASKFAEAAVTRSIVAEGSLLLGSELHHCVVGIRTRTLPGARISDSILMGADFYESDAARSRNAKEGVPDVGIGRDCVIERAIIDKNARIGAGCVIRGGEGHQDAEGPGWRIRDGIVMIEKNAVIPAGTHVE